jgi:amino acid adenylation domain-containing protein
LTRSPLSHGQRALWFLDRLAPGNAAYVVAGAVRVRSDVDPEALRRCLRALTARHAALRTVFREEDGGPVALVRAALEPDFTVVPAAESAGWDGEELARRLADFAYRGFDLERGPLVRLGLFERDGERGDEGGPLLVLALHHIVSDFWSLGLLVRELGALYGEAAGAGPADLAPLTLTYGDWVAAQEARLAGPEGERLWTWWRAALDGVPQVLELPADRPRPAVQGYRGATVELRLPGEMSRRLARLGRDRGATLVMTLLAGFGALLGRWTGQERLLIGMPTTGRRSRELAGLVGYLVNPVAVGIDLRADPSFGELVERVRDAARGAFDHQDFPLPLLAERLQPERDPSRPPFFQVAAVLQKGRRSGEDGIAALWAGAAGAAVPFGALELESIALSDPGAQFDVTLALAEWRGELVGRLQYDRDLFDGATVRRLAVQLERLLAAALADPAAPVSGLPLLGAAESHQVLVEWNEPAWAALGGGLLHGRFLRQARRAPEAEALVVGERRVSYGELAARSLELAARLRQRGVGPDVRVGVLCDRGVELVVGLLAVLEAGGCYVPLDPAYPAERLRLMLADSGAGLVLTHPALRGLLAGYGGEVEELTEALTPSVPLSRPAPHPSSLPPGEGTGVRALDALAYVIYTSGSTGQPKGVAITHRSAAALVDWALGRFAPAELAGTLASTSVCFDLSVFELFVPLTAGGRVILADNVLALPGLPAAAEVTLVNTVPSAMAELLRSGGLPAGVRTVNLAGEPLRQSLVAEIYRNDGWKGGRAGGVERIWNLYGPTEDTTYSTAQRIDREQPGEPAIGRPLPGGRAHVLDRRGELAPPGVPGELVLGGAGLARGYLGRGDLTAERFVPAPWGRPGSRLYRTGDLVRQRPDGGLVYLGRIDHQAKVRGFRVELGEVEAALRSEAGVREAVVAVHGDGPAAALAAYAAGEGLAPGGLRSALAARLPAYMVPSWITVLPALPRLPNGKVDRGALPRPLASGEAGEAPATPTEVALAAVWCELLGVRRVGRRDNFFHLGGHSLLAARLASRVREAFGVEMGPARAFEAPTLAALAQEIGREIERARGLGAAAPPLVAVDRSRPLPLSFAQERLWFLEQLEPGSAVYNVPGGLRLRGKLDVGAVASALQGIVARHEALRTSFRVGNESGPVQVVAAAVELALPVVDLSGLSGVARREAALRGLAGEEAVRPFDLGRAPLLRVLAVRLGREDQALLVTLHHLVSDGWSLGLLVRELAAGYGPGAPDLGPLPVQYGDFAVWQRSWLEGSGEMARQVDFWRGRLAGLPEALELPADLPRPAVQSGRGGQLPVRLGRGLAEAVRELARRSEATPFMVLLAAFGALLSRLTGQLDLAVGSPVAGRTRGETEELIGLFVNTLVLRCGLAGDPTVSELVGRARRTVLEATAHQELPFDKLVEALAPERDRSRPPLVQVVLAYQESALAGLALGDLEIEPLAFETGTAKFDLALALEDRGGELAGYLEYSSDLLYRATAKRFLEQLERLITAAVAEPGLRLSELPLLGWGERQQVVREWNDTAAAVATVANGEGGGSGWVGKASGWERGSVGAEISALSQFEAWVERAPEAPAVVAGVAGSPGRVWTYGDLNAWAERLADRLRGLGAGPGDVVAICLERSPELVAAVFGVGKSGAAYLPLDPAHPSERLAWQLQDAAVRLLVTDERHAGLAGGEVRVVLLSEIEAAVPGAGEGTGVRALDALAYVIYTSGSTGRPKGTLLGQRGLANLAAWHRQRYDLTPSARTTLVAGVGFDASVWELWPTLAAGASLWIPPAETVADPAALGAWIAENGITHSFLPTPLAEALLDDGLPEPHALRFLLTGGDRLHRSAPPGSRFRLVNHYGPTESTVVTTSWEVPPGTPGAPPIGRPIANLQALLLDRSFAPVPPGVAGELYVGGTGLAWGYLGRADLTAERFLPDAFATPDSGLGARLYRTGDVARFRPDGVLEFLGRADQQVKVRGHRIELGEIESALAAHPAVREAAVLVDGTGRNARLDAYLVARPGEDLSPEIVRAWLAGRLPAALIPTGWTLLEALPLNLNGKVDRQALARLSVERVDGLEGDRQAPATPTEETLAAIWSDLLGIERIGRQDHFFHLGGHSLLVARLATRIRDTFGVELGVARTFEVPTLAAQAAEIEQALGARRRSGPPLVPIARQGADGSAAELPASFAQERLWFLDQLAPGNPAYNIAGGMRLIGELDVAVLAAGLARIVERHEALRTTFGTVAGEGRPVQVIGPARAALPVIDLGGLRGEARAGEAERLAREEAARPFDLARGPLLRCTLLRTGSPGDAEHRLLITLHHIVGDGWSVAVLVRELGELYRAGTLGETARLPDLPVQYADFAFWQRQWLAGDELARQTAYWRDRLAGAPAALDLPADRPRPPVQSHDGAQVAIVLPADLRGRLAALARRREATPFMVLLAAWNALLLRTTGQDDLVVGTPVAGRTRRETEDLIGFFVNTLPLRADLSGDPGFTAALAHVRQGVLAAFAHQDLPFEKLVEALAPERDRSRSPIFQVMLAFQASPFAALALPGLAAEPFASPLPVAKFDLTLTLEESNGLLAGGLEYCRDLFDRATVERLAGRLRVLLDSVAADPDRRLSELPDLTPAEGQQLLEWNAAATAYPEADLLLHELIGRQAARTPEAPALVFAGQTLCYRDLWALAGRLAARLRTRGAGPETRVGICAERSPEMVVGLLAVLRAGAAYVPLDPSYPADRLAYMLSDSKVPLLLAQRRLAGVLPEHGAEVVWLEESGGDEQDLPELSLYPDAFDVQPLENPSPDGLAYVIYTSGSTGQPKGAMNTHRAIVNRLLWMQAEYGLTAADRVLQKTPFSFDVSVWEFFWPLLTGACLILARPGEHREPEALIRTIEAHGITTLHFVPSMLQLFLETPGVERCTSLRRVIASGEALPYDLQQRFFARLGPTGAGLHNLYGPTEAAVDVTYWPCDPAGRAGVVPIGRPVANTSIHLLDRNLVPVPLGAAGELYIGGVQLARGYHGKAGLTAERFVPDPFFVPDSFQVERRGFGARQSDRNGGLGARLYRTGDLARRLPSGEIEYLGRLDHQVKVRGFRIELGEIETALLEQPGVREAVVVARESRLVAYLVAPSSLERAGEAATDFANALAAVLGKRLPEYMVPSTFVLLPNLPLSPNGKVDRRALPEPSAARRDGGSAPATATEELLAGIWRDLLGLDPALQVGREDHFFHLGGHSLLAARVVSRIREVLAVEVPLARLFEAPTLAALASAIDELRIDQGLAGVGLPEIQRLERPAGSPAELPLSLSQERLWFLDQMEPGQALYNIPAAVRLRGALDANALAAALGALVERHETLRTRFANRRGAPVQVVEPPRPGQPVALPLVDLTALPGSSSALAGVAAAPDGYPAPGAAAQPVGTSPVLRRTSDAAGGPPPPGPLSRERERGDVAPRFR